MVRHNECNRFVDVLELLVERGFEGMAAAMQYLYNEALKLEREDFLGAESHERTPERRGYANGFKDKTVKSRVGELKLKIPQVREVADGRSILSAVLERGERSERALKLALAEMYVQGVSTRKVAAVTKELCGLEISSSQVSRVAEKLDEELGRWRNRPLGPPST